MDEDTNETTGPEENAGEKKKAPADCISPTPSGEDLAPEEAEKIMTSMLEILQECQKKVDIQKIDSHSLVFMLLRIKESLDAYHSDYIPKLNTYLVQAEKITGDYYAHMACTLRRYGDYEKALEAEEEDKIDVGGTQPVGKEDLINLVRTVTDNYYAAGMFLRPGRMVLKDVNNSQCDRQDIVNKLCAPLPKWLEFQEKVTCQLEQIREQTFKISAYVDFLKQGEMKMAPHLDLTALNQKPKTSDTRKGTRPKQDGPP